MRKDSAQDRLLGQFPVIPKGARSIRKQKSTLSGEGGSTRTFVEHGKSIHPCPRYQSQADSGTVARGKRYYVQLRQPGAKSARKISLDATNLTGAKQAAEDKRREAREGELPNRGRKPTFAAVADECLALAARQKKPRTVNEDRHRLNRWKAALGYVRVDLITTAMIAAQRDKRLRSGVSPRTVNLDLIAIRAVFKKCLEDGIIVKNPMDRLLKLKSGEPRERKFLRPAHSSATPLGTLPLLHSGHCVATIGH